MSHSLALALQQPGCRFGSVLECSVVCLDTSEFMRNGDYTPTRLGAMQDAVNSPSAAHSCHPNTQRLFARQTLQQPAIIVFARLPSAPH